jgi:DNA-binding response OmpR family regulator
MDHVTLSEVAVLPKVKPGDAAAGISLLPRLKHIRIGAYTVDAQTDVIRWRGEMLPLSSEQRQTLRILLQHAGQILSCERLASLLHVAAERVDTSVYSLRTARGRLRLHTLALTTAI